MAHDNPRLIGDWFFKRHKEQFDMIAEKAPEIQQAVNTLYALSADEKFRAEYEMRMESALDEDFEKGLGEILIDAYCSRIRPQQTANSKECRDAVNLCTHNTLLFS